MTKHDDTPIEQVIEKIQSKDVSKALNSLTGNFRILTFGLFFCIIIAGMIVGFWIIEKLESKFQHENNINNVGN